MKRDNLAIAKQVAAECAATTCSRLNKTITKVQFQGICDKYLIWINMQGQTDQARISSQAALKRAVLCIDILEPKLQTTDDILQFADELIKYFN